jgi:mannosyltransferase
MFSTKINKNKFFILFFILGCIFRWDGIRSGYWNDEFSSFYYSNPNLTIVQIYKAVIAEEGAQPLYFIIASKWNYLFGYYPETLRYFSFFLGSTSIILFIILLKEFSKNNYFLYFGTFLFVSNYFLIQFSQESRFYSLSLFFSILNLIFFFRFIKKKKNVYYYFFFLTLSLLTNIFSILLLFSQFIYLILNKKKINIFFFWTTLAVFIWYIIDCKYIETIFEKVKNDFYISDTVNLHFFIGYYFNIYFGSIFLGGLVLLFCFYNLKNFKKYKDYNISFCIISIFATYLIPVIYSVFKNPILRPRYIIFIVPIIIIYFCFIISKLNIKFIRKIVTFVIIACSVIIIFNPKPIIPKPDTESAIKLIASSDIKFLLIKTKNELFYNYFVNLLLAKKKYINFINDDQISDKKNFWIICLNNPRYSTNLKADDPNCLLNSYYKTHKILEIKKVSDYILMLYQKN